jgi:hypothetical protein
LRFVGWSSIAIGALMFAQWALFLVTGQVPELQTEPLAIGFHLVAEFVTAAALIISGLALLRGLAWATGISLVANGMLIYTVINSSGYFAQSGTWPPVIMFAALLVLATVSVALLVRRIALSESAS